MSNPRMNSLLQPDPPGTISPAKLLRSIVTTPEALVEAADLSRLPHVSNTQAVLQIGVQSDVPPTPTSIPQVVTIHKDPIYLPRISSEWDIEDECAAYASERYQDSRLEFEDQHDVKRRHAGKARSATSNARRTSHRGYFRSQTEHRLKLHVPVDIRADPGATVVIDRVTASIYDAYILRVDIMNNVNTFRRLQVSRISMSGDGSTK